MSTSRFASKCSVRCLGLALAAIGATPALAAAEIPPSLQPLVLHPHHRAVVSLELAGAAFEGLAPFSPRPFLLWPADPAAPAPFARDRAAVAAWIARCAAPLGHRDFTATFAETSNWRGDEVWSYRLARNGIELCDAQVRVHWRAQHFVGLVNDVPGEILAIEELEAQSEPLSELFDGEWTYWPLRREGGCELVLARREVAQDGERTITSFVDRAGRVLSRLVAGGNQEASGARGFHFTEHAVVSGMFPDQIAPDASGRVWFSQPLDDLIGSFQHAPPHYDRYETRPVGFGPDGLIVGRGGRVWTGLFYGGGLGMLDIASATFTSYPAPYPQAAMAIPMQARDGRIWVTDHLENRISALDPLAGTWAATHVMPTPNAWVVAGAEDELTGTIYFTEYNVNKLAARTTGGVLTDFNVPGGGPAFLAVSGRRVYYSEWDQARLGAYDIDTGASTEYAHPNPTELGGPLARMPDGDIVVGTRNRGYILVFDTATETFASYTIPTAFPGLKDGLAVDRHGVIWFTESGVNRIARLELD